MAKPLCQFGPGGEYRKAYPAGAKFLPESELELLEQKIAANPAGLARLAEDLGLEPPLVSIGPAGIQWQSKASQLKRSTVAPGCGRSKASQIKGVLGSVLDVLRVVKHTNSQAADAKLVASQVALADKTLARMAVLARRRERQVLQAGSADLAQVAMPASKTETPGRVAAGGDYAVSTESAQAEATTNEQENKYVDTNDAEKNGNPPVYSGFSQNQWLFPDDAGDRRPLEPNKGNGVRTRRRPGKKRLIAAGSQAQRSLFASLG